MTKPEIVTELTAMGVTFNPDDNAKVLSALLKAKKDEADPTPPPAQTKGKTVVFWLKSRAYINATERIEAGLYQVAELPERFANLGSETLEVFGKDMNSRKLAKISRWAGLNPDGVEDDELFATIVKTELLPF